MDWGSIGDAVSDAFDWLQDNEWAANALGTAASAGISYLSEREAAKRAADLEQRRYENSLAKYGSNNAVATLNNLGQYNAFTNNAMNKGGLLSGA